MKKYEVYSGTLRTVVQAESSRQAALWAVHQAMQQILPTDERSRSADEKSEHAASQGFSVLSDEVRVCERGMAAEQATRMPTLEVVHQWNEMVTTLDRLERMLYRAA